MSVSIEVLRDRAKYAYYEAKDKPISSLEFKAFRKASSEYARAHLLILYPEIIQENDIEYEKLQSELSKTKEKLSIAIEALNYISDGAISDPLPLDVYFKVARESLKKIEVLK